MQPLSGNQRPDLLTTLISMAPVLRLPRKMHLCKSSSNESPSGTIGERPFWVLEGNFCRLRVLGPAIKIPFWDHWETALLGQILVEGLLEGNFCHFGALGAVIKISFWDHWETALLGQILAEALLEANFCHLKAPGPAIKIPFWDHWETALLGQIPAGKLLEAAFTSPT